MVAEVSMELVLDPPIAGSHPQLIEKEVLGQALHANGQRKRISASAQSPTAAAAMHEASGGS
jgi:hypothetical protein